ncbi:MAG: hypothetical protein AAB225_20705, partial [Acidobacteriota bacterium]
MILAAGLLAAPQADDRKAQSLMQAAQSKETIEGDLKSAIDLYRQAVRAAGKDRSLAARAMLRLAACQEKQGAAEAKRTYEEILRSYSDQSEAVRIARLKLGVGAEGGPAQVTIRQLWNSPDMGNTGSVSPSGRYITYTHWQTGDIRIIDLTTGETRTLFSRGGWEKSNDEFGMNSLFSPDG